MCTRADGLPDAVKAAEGADLVIAVFGEPQEYSGEAASRTRLTLSGKQIEVLEALARTGKPIALILESGRPLELGKLAETIPSIMMTWYPGTEGGTALADVLFGDVSPSGKLPVTYPRSVGQLPLYYNRLPSGRPTLANNRYTLNYLDEDVTPLFPFGWGLSYTRFSFTDAGASRTHLGPADTLAVTVTVTNTGGRAGQEVVQLYVRDPVASRSRPVRELKASKRWRCSRAKPVASPCRSRWSSSAFIAKTGRMLWSLAKSSSSSAGTHSRSPPGPSTSSRVSRSRPARSPDPSPEHRTEK